MRFINFEKKILEEILAVLVKNPEKSEKELGEAIISAKKIFVAGCGRSGLVSKAFAMRLMQTGKTVFVVGETITSSITKKDLLICVSSSGKTRSILDFANEAKEVGAKVVCITSKVNGELAKISNLVVLLDISKKSVQPLGSLFEQSTLIFLDAVIIGIMRELKISEKSLKQKHASLE